MLYFLNLRQETTISRLLGNLKVKHLRFACLFQVAILIYSIYSIFFLTSLISDFRFSPFFHFSPISMQSHGTWRQPTLDSAAVDTLTGTTGTTGTLLEP